MSILKNKIKNSSMEFLFGGRELQAFTIKKCVNFPKKYRPYLGQELIKISANINEKLVCANTIHPNNEFEKCKKIEFFADAIAYLNCLVEQLEIANELLYINKKDLQKWGFIITEEIELIKEQIDMVEIKQ